MLKPFIVACATAAAIASVGIGAVSMASANNASTTAREVTVEVAIETHTGIVNCADQVWPAIDAYCLKPVSEMGEIRQARLIEM